MGRNDADLLSFLGPDEPDAGKELTDTIDNERNSESKPADSNIENIISAMRECPACMARLSDIDRKMNRCFSCGNHLVAPERTGKADIERSVTVHI